jgi:hypothetical protein
MPFGSCGMDAADRLERIEAVLQRMFVDDRHAFDLAMSALLGGAAPQERGGRAARDRPPGQRGRARDPSRAGRPRQRPRRDRHPAVLVYMSIVKDVERIGDYAKNLFDIAADGVSLHDHE